MPKSIDSQKIVQLYTSDTPIAEIARITGYSRTTIFKHLKLEGKWKRHIGTDSNEILERYVNKKHSVSKISLDMNLSATTVRKYLYSNNVEIRDNSIGTPEMLELYQQGLLITDIATILECSHTAVSNYLKRNNTDISNHKLNLNHEAVLSYYTESNSLCETSFKFNVGQQTIKKILLNEGVTTFRHKVWDENNDNKIIEMYKNGFSANEIGKKYGYTHTTILRHLIRLGVKTRKKYTEAKRSTGYKEILGSHWSSIKGSASTRGLDFEITKEYVYKLFLKQDSKCAISGVNLCFAKTNNGYVTGDFSASLDRIDSSKGYIKGNVQWTHKKVNIMKQSMSDEELIEWCRIIVNNN